MKKLFSIFILFAFVSANCAFAEMEYYAKMDNQTEYVEKDEYTSKSDKLFHGHAEKSDTIKRDDQKQQ